MFKKGHQAWNKGKHHSEKHKRNLSKNHADFKGKNHPMCGKHHTKKSKLQISKTRIERQIKPVYSIPKGKRISPSTEFKKGMRPWSWKGGITPLVRSVRTLPEYKQWRSDVYQRDDWICQTCWERGGKLEAHHKKEFAKILRENKITSIAEARACKELWDITNGITLCKDCHNLTKQGKAKWLN